SCILYVGFQWRASSPAERPQLVLQEPLTQPEAETPKRLSSRSAGPDSAAEPAASKAKPSSVKRASADELVAAVSKGADGLLPLSERYPRDPAVLKPLVMAFASRATTLADAMAVTKRLFRVAPEEILDSELRFLVRRGAA